MNVVKVGHKQVVSLIRQGGNRLLMKVVSVTRKPETEEVIRKKGEKRKVVGVDLLCAFIQCMCFFLFSFFFTTSRIYRIQNLIYECN